MNELLLDSSHDLSLTADGHIARIADGVPGASRIGCEQRCLCLLRCEEGESFVDYTHGVPWFGKILSIESQHLDVATAIIRDKLSRLSSVKKVLKISLEVKGRNVGGKFKVQAEDGSVATGEF